MYAPPPDGGFSLSDAEISPSVPRALFGELLCQAPEGDSLFIPRAHRFSLGGESVGAEGAVVAGAVAGGRDLEEGGGVGECPEEDEDGGEGGGVVRDFLRVCSQRGDVEVCARVPCAGFETRKLLKE